MPLFGSNRDSGLMRGINEELLQKVIGEEVAIYKFALAETETNLYDESNQKTYYNPVRVFTLIEFGEKGSITEEFGLNYEKTATFGFMKDELITKGLTIEEGDIIFHDDRYYEIDQVSNTKYWTGRNPDSNIGMVEDAWKKHGYDLTIIADAHLTPSTGLNIVDKRSGIQTRKQNRRRFL